MTHVKEETTYFFTTLLIMGLINWLRNRSLRKKLKQLQRSPGAVNVENAQSIGLIFEAVHSDVRQSALAYAEKWRKKGKKVELLAFLDLKKVEEDLPFPYFSKREIDWLKRPQGPSVQHFLNTPIDILICLSAHPGPALQYLVAISPAPLKVGAYEEDKESYFDMMIDPGNKEDVNFFLKQVDFYLEKINVDHAA